MDTGIQRIHCRKTARPILRKFSESTPFRLRPRRRIALWIGAFRLPPAPFPAGAAPGCSGHRRRKRRFPTQERRSPRLSNPGASASSPLATRRDQRRRGQSVQYCSLPATRPGHRWNAAHHGVLSLRVTRAHGSTSPGRNNSTARTPAAGSNAQSCQTGVELGPAIRRSQGRRITNGRQ